MALASNEGQSATQPSRSLPKSLDLTVLGAAVLLDQVIYVARTGITSLQGLPIQVPAYLVAGVIVLVLGLVWKPHVPRTGEPSLGVKGLALYTSLSFLGLLVLFTIPSFTQTSQQQGEINAFLAAMFLVIFVSTLYLIGKSLWTGSNTARLTSMVLFALLILISLSTPNLTAAIPSITTPVALIWYMRRRHVSSFYSPPPPPEAANYVLRTRAEPVKCANCGTMNPAGAQTCTKCSAPLIVTAEAGQVKSGALASAMIPVQEELKSLESKLVELEEFKKSHSLLNPEAYDGLIQMQKRRLEELRALNPARKPTKPSKQS